DPCSGFPAKLKARIRRVDQDVSQMKFTGDEGYQLRINIQAFYLSRDFSGDGNIQVPYPDSRAWQQGDGGFKIAELTANRPRERRLYAVFNRRMVDGPRCDRIQ